MDEKRKILICGDVRGNLSKLFERIRGITKEKGDFDILFCVGKFLSSEKDLAPFKKGEETVPLPTYFIAGPHDIQQFSFLREIKEGGDICPNLTYLGDYGIREIKGLSIGYFSDTSSNATEKVTKFLEKVSYPQYKGIDILITNDWPRNLLSNLTGESQFPRGISMLEIDDWGSEIVTQVVSAVVPRYHFASSPKTRVFYERIPYRNGPQFDGQRNFHVTRFLALGEVFNNKNHRFLYALSLQPLNGMNPTELYNLPHHTDFPFNKFIAKKPEESPTKKQKTENLSEMDKKRFSGQFMDNTKPNYAQRQNTRSRTQLTSGARSAECWFCLSSSICETHLIVTLAKHFYLCMAKGGITDSHMLIVPIKHIPNQLDLPSEIIPEFNLWKDAIRKFFSSREEVTVFYEHNWPAKNQHLHIQVISFPKKDSERIKGFFEKEGKILQMAWTLLNPEDNFSKEVDSPYFWLELPDRTQMVSQFRDDYQVPFSFGRKVIAGLLNQPTLEDWKVCVQAKLIEEKITKDMREMFKPFHPPLV